MPPSFPDAGHDLDIHSILKEKIMRISKYYKAAVTGFLAVFVGEYSMPQQGINFFTIICAGITITALVTMCKELRPELKKLESQALTQHNSPNSF